MKSEYKYTLFLADIVRDRLETLIGNLQIDIERRCEIKRMAKEIVDRVDGLKDSVEIDALYERLKEPTQISVFKEWALIKARCELLETLRENLRR